MRRRHVAVVAVGLAACAACGVPTQDSFDRVAPADFAVDPPVVTEPDTSVRDERTVLPVRPYFVAEGGITPLPESLASYESILHALQTRPEDGTGLRTAVSADAVAAIRTEGTSVVVDLTEAFQSLPPEEQRLAAAQLVLTLTDRAPAVRIAFSLSGQAVDVPTADSSISIGGAVSRADYAALLAQN